jgi:hypothetical protein
MQSVKSLGAMHRQLSSYRRCHLTAGLHSRLGAVIRLPVSTTGSASLFDSRSPHQARQRILACLPPETDTCKKGCCCKFCCKAQGPAAADSITCSPSGYQLISTPTVYAKRIEEAVAGDRHQDQWDQLQTAPPCGIRAAAVRRGPRTFQLP